MEEKPKIESQDKEFQKSWHAGALEEGITDEIHKIKELEEKIKSAAEIVGQEKENIQDLAWSNLETMYQGVRRMNEIVENMDFITGTVLPYWKDLLSKRGLSSEGIEKHEEVIKNRNMIVKFKKEFSELEENLNQANTEIKKAAHKIIRLEESGKNIESRVNPGQLN